jgi:hypothetical protein
MGQWFRALKLRLGQGGMVYAASFTEADRVSKVLLIL